MELTSNSPKVHFIVQKNSEICHKFMFSLTRFLWQKSKQEKASKREVKTHKSAMENLQILHKFSF